MTVLNKCSQLKGICVVLLLVFLTFSLAACKEATVKVRTGTRIVCKYGELLQDKTKEIRVSKAEVDKYHVVTLMKLCRKHQKLESLQKAAREALEAGDSGEAQEIIKEIGREEPKLRAAAEKKAGDQKAQLKVIESVLIQQEAKSIAKLESEASGNSPRPQDMGNSASLKTEPPTATTEVVESGIDLGSFLPLSITDYYAGSLNVGENFAARDFQPYGSKEVEFLLITVHLKESEETAKKFIEKVSKVAFPRDAQMVTIDGKTAYFGTDDTTYANLSWNEGKIVCEVQMMSATGKPKRLNDYIINIGELIAQGVGE